MDNVELVWKYLKAGNGINFNGHRFHLDEVDVLFEEERREYKTLYKSYLTMNDFIQFCKSLSEEELEKMKKSC